MKEVVKKRKPDKVIKLKGARLFLRLLSRNLCSFVRACPLVDTLVCESLSWGVVEVRGMSKRLDG